MSGYVISNWDEVATKWRLIELQPVFRSWAAEIGPVIQEALKTKAPKSKGPNSGRFASTIRYRTNFSAKTKVLKFYSMMDYAKYIVNDTAPHLIIPKQAKALHFTSGDGKVFAKKVHHPGTKANKFAEEVALASKTKIDESLKKYFIDALKS